MNTYEAWVMMNADCDVITEEHGTPDAVLAEILEKYTVEEAHENGFTLNKLLCDDKCWFECLEEIEY